MKASKAVLTLILVLCGAPVAAQEKNSGAVGGSSAVEATESTNARLLRPNEATAQARARLGLTPREARPLAPVPGAGGLSKSEAMMVVGGVALILGAVIGDDEGTIIMVGGAVIGLLGLWRWLQ